MGLFSPDFNKLEKKKKFKELIRYLDNDNPSIRYSAFAALAGKADLSDEVKSKLKGMMYHDPDPWVKTIATLRFAELGDPDISENLIQIIKEGTQKSKLELLRIITENGVSSDVTVLQVIMIGLADKKVLVRHQAISAANATKNRLLLPMLCDMLHERYYRIRLFAAKAIYNIGRDEVVDNLIELLSDKNTEVHSAARTYLSAINSGREYKFTADDESPDPDDSTDGNEHVREKTPQRIGQKSIKRGLAILENGCRDKFRGVRIEALKSIAIFRNPLSIDIVEELLYDKFPEVRIEAVNTMEKIGGQRAIEAIEKISKDRKKIVREAVERSLARLRR